MSDTRPRLKFITAIVADDVRQETSGKQILIGIYSENMVVSEFLPTGGIRAAVFVMFEAPEIGQMPVKIKILGPGQTD
jgi:hypothetical protein